MELLTRYVDVAIERGLIDEWHIWDFSRNAADARWLRRRFPMVQATPSHTTEYFALPERLKIEADEQSLRFDVCATSDVHIGLRRLSGSGESYEIVLGGWNNQASAIRAFAESEKLVNPAARDPQEEPVALRMTPDLLPEFGFVSVEIDCGPSGLSVRMNDEEILHGALAIEPGVFEILYRTGYGANGEWLFPQTQTSPARLFVRGPSPHFPPDAMFYTSAYQYYCAQRDRYADDVFLKCDDDIVFIDIERLADFIAFRKSNPQYFLVSANVVNNGVCAFFQQAAGAIPRSFDELELPPGGMCGSLWSSGARAERLHALFVKNPDAFRNAARDPIVWRERISINFVSWLGADLVHIPDIMSDDEHDLCYGVRKRTGKVNCIDPRFVVSHLSFWKQEAEMNVEKVIDDYSRVAERELNPQANGAAHAIAAPSLSNPCAADAAKYEKAALA